MLFTELPIVFPWYPNVLQQNRYREHAGELCDFRLITPVDALLPWEFRKPLGAQVPTSWRIYTSADDFVVDISASIPMLNMRRAGGWEYWYYGGEQLMHSTGTMELGQNFYYSVLTFPDDVTYYSELFFVQSLQNGGFRVADDGNIPFMKIEWWNDSDIRPIFYNNRPVTGTKPVFRNVLYVDTFISSSAPEVTVDGTRDGYDQVVPTFFKAVIPYRVAMLVPDYLKRALAILDMHDHIWITEKAGARMGELERIEVQTNDEQGGALSMVELLFEEDLAMLKKGCADNMAMDCPGSAPNITSVVYGSGLTSYVITGTAPAGSFIAIYKRSTVDGPITVATATQYTAAQFLGGITVDIAAFFGGNYIVVRAYSFGCEFGLSNTVAKPS